MGDAAALLLQRLLFQEDMQRDGGKGGDGQAGDE